MRYEIDPERREIQDQAVSDSYERQREEEAVNERNYLGPEEKTGEQLKLEGLEKACSKHGPEFERAKMVAYALGLSGEPVNAEDVRRVFEECYYHKLDIGNAIGNLFRDGKWVHAGYVKAKRPQSHGCMISQWRLVRHEP